MIEYLNVRIRHRHSLLFSDSIYEDLLSGNTLGTLTTFLLDNPDYCSDVEEALEHEPEREGLERGVTNHFAHCISRTLNMAGEKSRELFKLALFSFDLKYIRNFLLARKMGLSSRETLKMLVPCCSITEHELGEMLNTRDTGELCFFLSRHFPYGSDTLKEVIETDSNDIPITKFLNIIEENAYKGILQKLDVTDQNKKILKDIIRHEIDMKNIATALKEVWNGDSALQSTSAKFISGGFINRGLLDEISQAKELDEAFEMIEGTQFSPAVEKGIIYFAETGFLHEMERFFEEVLINKIIAKRRFDPFGIGVFIGFIWGKYVELTNLRTIINGIAFKLGRAQIRKGLIHV